MIVGDRVQMVEPAIEIMPYQTDWPVEYQTIAELLRRAAAPCGVVGSQRCDRNAPVTDVGLPPESCRSAVSPDQRSTQ